MSDSCTWQDLSSITNAREIYTLQDLQDSLPSFRTWSGCHSKSMFYWAMYLLVLPLVLFSLRSNSLESRGWALEYILNSQRSLRLCVNMMAPWPDELELFLSDSLTRWRILLFQSCLLPFLYASHTYSCQCKQSSLPPLLPSLLVVSMDPHIQPPESWIIPCNPTVSTINSSISAS